MPICTRRFEFRPHECFPRLYITRKIGELHHIKGREVRGQKRIHKCVVTHLKQATQILITYYNKYENIIDAHPQNCEEEFKLVHICISSGPENYKTTNASEYNSFRSC